MYNIDVSEYALLLVKPDGNEKNLTEYILNYLKEYGLIEVCRNSLTLSKSNIDEAFTHVYNDKRFRAYMTRGKVTAIILKGENAYQKLRILKTHIRKSLNTDIMENILHSSEAGNEYDIQFRTLFPNLDINNYTLYADMYYKTSFPNEYNQFCDKFRLTQKATNVKAISYIFNNDVFQSICDNIARYKNENGLLISSSLGLEYSTKIREEEFKLLGYYSMDGDMKSIIKNNKYIYHNVKDLIKKIKDSGGVPFISYMNKRQLFDSENDIFSKLNNLGVYGCVTYHPQYTLSETENLRRNVLENNMILTGGSGGLSELGRFGVPFETFNDIYELIYGKKYADISFVSKQLNVV